MRRWRRVQWEARPIIGYAVMSIDLALFVFVMVSAGWSHAWSAALFGAVLLIVWRHARSGVFVNGSGVRVVRFWGTEVLPWDQLAGVEVSSDDRPQLLLRSASGGIIRTGVYRGIGRRNDYWLRTGTFDRLVARLREHHSRG